MEEAKLAIVKEMANHIDGHIAIPHLELLMKSKLGNELYTAAINSLVSEYSIREKTVVVRGISHHWELTDSGKEKYKLRAREYIHESDYDPTSGMVRVVGTGGQTLDYVTAPDKRECLYMCCGFIIVAIIIILIALSM